jgi:hypothetical protein
MTCLTRTRYLYLLSVMIVIHNNMRQIKGEDELIMPRRKKQTPKVGDEKIVNGKNYELQLVCYEDGFDALEWVCIDAEFEYLFGDLDEMPESMKKGQKKRVIDIGEWAGVNDFYM